MSDRKSNRDIGTLRDSAFSMRVGDPEDGAIVKTISLEDELIVVLEHAIYAVQLADQVDPQRTNPAVPNTKQRLLTLGAKDPAVGRIFLTAESLFNTAHLGNDFPAHKGVSFAFKLLRDIAAMMAIHSALVAEIKRITANAEEHVAADRSLQLPAIGDAKARFDAFAQKVGHAIKSMKDIALLFYPNQLFKKWVDSLVTVCSKTHGEDDPLTQFITQQRERLVFMIELRNKIEHPEENDRVTISDFRLTPELQVIPPQVQIVASGQPSTSQPLSSFMSDIIEELVATAESFIGLLCEANAKSRFPFPVVLYEIPPNRRPADNPHQRIAYGIVMDGKVHPMG